MITYAGWVDLSEFLNIYVKNFLKQMFTRWPTIQTKRFLIFLQEKSTQLG